MRSITTYLVLFLLAASGSAFAQENWFEAQSEKAVVKSIVSTSELVEGQYDGRYLYPPINLLDGDFSTTWCEADEGGSGIGESITLELEEPLSFNEIQLVNGFASGNDYYHKNNRVAKITLTQTAGQHFQQKQYSLSDDVEGWQSINFDLLQTAQIISIRIEDVYRGIKYDDTCFSDIRFLRDGEVIPFGNVGEIRVVQEEHSRSLLHSEKGAFLREIKAMAEESGKDRVLYLNRKGTNEGLYFSFGNRETFRDSSVSLTVGSFEYYPVNDSSLRENAILYSLILDSAGNQINLNPQNRDSLYKKMAERGLSSLSYESYNWSMDSSSTLKDYKLITVRNIDYVQTETTELLKLDGNKGIYINGVYYQVLNEEDMLFLIEEP